METRKNILNTSRLCTILGFEALIGHIKINFSAENHHSQIEFCLNSLSKALLDGVYFELWGTDWSS